MYVDGGARQVTLALHVRIALEFVDVDQESEAVQLNEVTVVMVSFKMLTCLV